MEDYSFIQIKKILEEKDEKIKELENKLLETTNNYIQLNKNLDQKLIEKTLDVNILLREKARFIDNLSHDLATPLTPIISLLPLVKEEISNPELIEILDTCIRCAEYIKRVVNNSRELADISVTDLLLKKEKINDIVDIILKKYEPIFTSINIKIENKIKQEIYVKTEKNRLLQVFDHVISNAVNSMPNGGRLIFELKPILKESETFFKISIIDTGIGLTRQQIDRIFDEFYKTDESRHKLDSTGLGLTICKKIIEKHGGKIWADSHGKGTGTSINFTIPSSEIIYDRSF